MKKPNNKPIVCLVRRDVGAVPPFLLLAQRHFEKAPPAELNSTTLSISATVPVDMLRLLLPNDSWLIEGIEEISVHYAKS